MTHPPSLKPNAVMLSPMKTKVGSLLLLARQEGDQPQHDDGRVVTLLEFVNARVSFPGLCGLLGAPPRLLLLLLSAAKAAVLMSDAISSTAHDLRLKMDLEVCWNPERDMLRPIWLCLPGCRHEDSPPK